MTAPQYVEHLMSWVQSNVDNEQMFPSRIGIGTSCSTIIKANQLLQVFPFHAVSVLSFFKCSNDSIEYMHTSTVTITQ